jgi:hypothetical protein
MRKSFFLFAFLLATTWVFSQNEGNYPKVAEMLKDGLKDSNYIAIQEEAAKLSDTERLRLYNVNKMDLWTGAGVNFFAPMILGTLNFGIGNFVQRDYLAGGIALGSELVGSALLIVGLAGYIYPYSKLDRDLSIGLIAGGGAVTVGASLFGTIKALIYPRSYNNKLRDVLSVGGLVLNIEPSIDLSERGTELALFRLQY